MTGPRACGGPGCGCDGYASPIDGRDVEADLRRYRTAGPDRTTRMLLDMIEAAARPGMTLLDIGGGIGVIDLELLSSGASRAVLVEATPAYLQAAREQAKAAGVEDRLEVVPGDFVRRAADIGEADIVTLDRVVCCYPDADALVSASTSRARALYGLVLPRDRWWVRWFIRLENILWWLRRRGYRGHAHSHAAIETLAQANGFRRQAEATTAIWRVVLYGRERASEVSSSRI